MSKRLQFLSFFGFTFVLFIFGCNSCGCGGGRDPVLGKTRVDPPTTNVRSVYVERQNVNECGVVPGGGNAGRNACDSNPAGIIQPGAGSVQTVHYPNGLDSVDETAASDQNQNSAENSHLRWVSVEAPQTREIRGPSLSDLGTRELTEEELANYRYVYDFSVMPPRKVPVGRSAGAVSSESPSAGNPAAPGSSPDPYMPRSGQFISQNFDPYAPNRQFERRKAKLARTMATEFDEVEANPMPVQTANSDAPRNEMTPGPSRVAQTQISAKDSGWRVVAAPDPASSPSAAPTSNEAVAGTQIAPVQKSVGTKVQVPEKASEKAPAPGKVSEKVRENVPESPKTGEDSALDLFDLPRR